MVSNEGAEWVSFTDRPPDITGEQWAILTGSVPQRFVVGIADPNRCIADGCDREIHDFVKVDGARITHLADE